MLRFNFELDLTIDFKWLIQLIQRTSKAVIDYLISTALDRWIYVHP